MTLGPALCGTDARPLESAAPASLATPSVCSASCVPPPSSAPGPSQRSALEPLAPSLPPRSQPLLVYQRPELPPEPTRGTDSAPVREAVLGTPTPSPPGTSALPPDAAPAWGPCLFPSPSVPPASKPRTSWETPASQPSRPSVFSPSCSSSPSPQLPLWGASDLAPEQPNREGLAPSLSSEGASPQSAKREFTLAKRSDHGSQDDGDDSGVPPDLWSVPRAPSPQCMDTHTRATHMWTPSALRSDPSAPGPSGMLTKTLYHCVESWGWGQSREVTLP